MGLLCLMGWLLAEMEKHWVKEISQVAWFFLRHEGTYWKDEVCSSKKKALRFPVCTLLELLLRKNEININNSNGFTDRMTLLQHIITRNSVPGIFYQCNLMQGRIVIILLALEYYDSEHRC